MWLCVEGGRMRRGALSGPYQTKVNPSIGEILHVIS